MSNDKAPPAESRYLIFLSAAEASPIRPEWSGQQIVDHLRQCRPIFARVLTPTAKIATLRTVPDWIITAIQVGNRTFTAECNHVVQVQEWCQDVKTITATFTFPQGQATASASFDTLPGDAPITWWGDEAALAVLRAAGVLPWRKPQIGYASTFEDYMKGVAKDTGATVQITAEGAWVEEVDDLRDTIITARFTLPGGAVVTAGVALHTPPGNAPIVWKGDTAALAALLSYGLPDTGDAASFEADMREMGAEIGAAVVITRQVEKLE